MLKILKRKNKGELASEMISKSELERAKKYKAFRLAAEKKGEPILGANTPLNIPDVDFVDYRDEIWGDSYNWSWNRPLSQVAYLAIHHTVTKATQDSKADVDYIARLHKDRGWDGVGYHIIITRDGKVWYVGDIGTARANVANMNEKVIGISMIGDFTKYLPSDAQISAAHKVCKFFISKYPALTNITNWNNLVGHKDLQATACPGSSWSSDMKWRIETGTVYTPPEPVDNKYRVTFEKKQVWEGDYNPIPKIKELEEKNKEIAGKLVISEAKAKDLQGKLTISQNQLKTCQVKLKKYEDTTGKVILFTINLFGLTVEVYRKEEK